jgi:hypothetical protein
MSIQQKQPARHKQRRSPSLPDVSTLHPNQILSLSEWSSLNGFSIRTGRRIRASGDGPVVTQLSPQRVGVSVANNARWQKSRERGPRPTSPKRRARINQYAE